MPVTADDAIQVEQDPYVSRAAHKLAGALRELALDVTDQRALDAGASTGGFTQVLLRAGCREVIAVDVGHGQLVEEIRSDPRVLTYERLNVRDLRLEHVDHRLVDLVVGDLSFISLIVLLPALTAVVDPAGSLLLMVKPQFEVGRERLGDGGVVRSPALHVEAVTGVIDAAAAPGLADPGRGAQPVAGSGGQPGVLRAARPASTDRSGRCRGVRRLLLTPAYAVPGDASARPARR